MLEVIKYVQEVTSSSEKRRAEVWKLSSANQVACVGYEASGWG